MSVQSKERTFTRSEFVMEIIEEVFALNWSVEATAELIVDVLQTLDNFTFTEKEES